MSLSFHYTDTSYEESSLLQPLSTTRRQDAFQVITRRDVPCENRLVSIVLAQMAWDKGYDPPSIQAQVPCVEVGSEIFGGGRINAPPEVLLAGVLGHARRDGHWFVFLRDIVR